ncbi:type II toxin-antitoxin system RelE/ParE family toxin [Inquilinus ginsengisoli]|uniref:type II toxin-antitoxin system RelE/ParE family toxin n=1 Tax=Inquilinus ginsengisoli TaxID=363840 RepID=UPI003D23AEC1
MGGEPARGAVACGRQSRAFPASRPSRHRGRHSGTPPYVIVYRIVLRIEIVRVWHSAQSRL